MEIPKEIVTEIFLLTRTASEHEEIKKLLDFLYEKELKDIVSIDKNVKLKENDRKIHQVISRLLIGIHSRNSKDIVEFSQIIKNSLIYLESAIENKDIKALLVFLSVHCYSNIAFDIYLKEISITPSKKEIFLEKIVAVLKNARTETAVPRTAPYYEKQLKANSVKGFKEKNITKIYDLILAIERSGRGFHFNYLLENLTNFLFHFDLDSYVEQLNFLKHPDGNVFYLQGLTKEQLVRIALHKRVSNCWTLFELIRQIADNEIKNENVDLFQKNGINSCLGHLYLIDPKIYEQSITFFNSNTIFCSALGTQLNTVTKAEIVNVFENLLPMDIYDFNLQPRTLLLMELKSSLSVEKYTLVLKTVYDRWQKLFSEVANNEDSFQNKILLTDYADYIIQYYAENISNKDLKDLVLKSLDKTMWIGSEWFNNLSHQITKYHLYLTELFLLSYAYKQNKIEDIKVGNTWLEFKNSVTDLRYSIKPDGEEFKAITENLS